MRAPRGFHRTIPFLLAATLVSFALGGCLGRVGNGASKISRASTNKSGPSGDGEAGSKPPRGISGPPSPETPPDDPVNLPQTDVPGPVAGTVSAVDVPQTFVSSRWRASTPNGWYPQVSPDGKYVTYGFNGNTLADLATHQETQIDSQGFWGYWIRPGVYTFIHYTSNVTAERYEVDAATRAATRTSDDPSLVAGNQFVAADGHWASWLGTFRIAEDNAVVQATGAGRNVNVSQDWLAYASDNSNSVIRVWKGGQRYRDYPTQIPMQQMQMSRGYIVYGGYGRIHGITPDGKETDQTATPWTWEVVPQVLFVGGKPWVASVGWSEALQKGYILLRPWDDPAAIVVEAAAATLHVVAADGNFVAAYGDDKGALSVVTFPIRSPRYILK